MFEIETTETTGTWSSFGNQALNVDRSVEKQDVEGVGGADLFDVTRF